MNDITNQIQRFDRLLERIDPAGLAQQVVREATELGHTQTFTATLSEDLCIEAAAEIGLDGSVEAVTIYRSEGGQRVDPAEVDPGSGLWRAMEVWWERFRTTWTE